MHKLSKLNYAGSGKTLALTHRLSSTDQARLVAALSNAALVIYTISGAEERKAQYEAHTDRLFEEFSSAWNFAQATQAWTKTSISNILQVFVSQRQSRLKRQATSGPEAESQPNKTDGVAEDRSSKSGPVVASPAVKRRRPHQQSATSSASSGFKSINKPTTLPAHHAMGSSSSPLRSNDTISQAPIVSIDPRLEQISVEGRKNTTEGGLEERPSIKLVDIVVTVKPSPRDPWGRDIVSFPLWRCQVPIDGRDAPPEALRDWRDLSFFDFVRQLKAEKVIFEKEMLVWGEMNKIVISNLTFSGAIEQQIQHSPRNARGAHVAHFKVISRL
ncbi:hypothetical protein D6D20_00226 [Aureobasidium pullulans]|uniref:Uncharacterized protein n=1 Tax=Aureobasidium pullulans TaxID=5580 RepID=A0A4S8ZP97_AURPU|nr:hypothetical protein D6D20_00226 [Aureobasidium pullulans]THZ97370.1 hypothetical protein D6C82_06467 [Aureobasidium pullulans]